MSVDILIVFGLLIAAIFLFSSEKISFDITALLLLSVLLLTGILTPEEGFSGFSNSATITVAAMFILSEGIRRTGALNKAGDYFSILGRKNHLLFVSAIMFIVGVISAFINNTAAVAIFIPVIIQVAKDLDVSPSKLLMPLSFASMFGGVCTLIGTSTNILVSSIAEEHGLAAFSMFEFTPLGLLFFGAGFLYMLIFGIDLIPQRRGEGGLTQDFAIQEYLTDVVIEPDSDWIGIPIDKAPVTQSFNLDLIRVFKKSGGSAYKQSTSKLEAGDVLRVHGSVREIDNLLRNNNVSLKPAREWHDVDLEQGSDTLVEAIIAPESSLEQKTIGEVNFMDRFGAVVLAIRRKGELQQDDLRDIPLSGGDSILLSMSKDRVPEVQNDVSFVLASEVGLSRFRSDKIMIALAILAGVILVAAFDIFPIVVSATFGVVLMAISGCITTEEAYNAVNWKVIMLLAGILPFGIAMEKTGAAQLISNVLINYVGSLGPTALLSGFFFLSMILTNLISNQATAALLAPVAIETASIIDVNARPLLLAVTFSASLSFMTPVGYQTNTLIFGPGQYKFSDFTKVGTPLNIIFWILATIFIPIFWSF